MNRDRLMHFTGWTCEPVGQASVRAVSPLTLGEDGRHAAFYIAQPTVGTFYLTDAGETALYAAQSGVALTKPRLEALNKTAGVHFARFGADGAITAGGAIEDAEFALWDAAKLAMSLSFNSRKWMPKVDHARFRALVERTLVTAAGRDRVKGKSRVQGISGHWIEFPLTFQSSENELWFVEPIALAVGEKIDWGRVHQAFGKLADVKQADDSTNRVVVFENGASEAEFGRAATLLAQSAHITTLATLSSWTASRVEE